MSLGSFSKSEFDGYLDDLERNLSELKAFEMIDEAWVRWITDMDQLANVGAEYYWDVPSEKHPFQWIFITPAFPDQEGEWKAVIDECWQEGKTWASGIASGFKDLTQRWAEPDANAIIEAARLMDAKVASDLEGLLVDDWSANSSRGTSLERTLEHWEGRAANSFSTFYSNVDDKLAYYAGLTNRVAGFWASHAVVLDAGQLAMLEIAKKAAEHSDAQVANWAASHAVWPYGSTDGAFTAAQVLDVIAVGADVASLVPPLAPAAGTVSTVTGLVQKIEERAGSGAKKNADFKADKSFDIYRDTYDKMNLDAVVDTTSAMLNLRNGEGEESSSPSAGTGDVIGDAEDQGRDFYTPRLYDGPNDWTYTG